MPVQMVSMVATNTPGKIENRNDKEDFKKHNQETSGGLQELGYTECVEPGKGKNIYIGGDAATTENSRGQSVGEERSLLGLFLHALFGRNKGSGPQKFKLPKTNEQPAANNSESSVPKQPIKVTR